MAARGAAFHDLEADFQAHSGKSPEMFQKKFNAAKGAYP